MKMPVRLVPAMVAAIVVVAAAGDRAALGQLSATDEERLQILSDPEAAKAKAKDEKAKPPFELFRSQFAPFDVLPFLKPWSWSTVTLEVRANDVDYEGGLQFQPIALPGMPQEVVYARDARLPKEQRSRLNLQVLVPHRAGVKLPKELAAELIRPGAIRADDAWTVPMKLIPPTQMLVVVMSKESSGQYAAWNRYPCFVPSSADPADAIAVDLARYYRLVLPEHADKPFLSPHPLTWGPISHVIWDGLPPDSVAVSHQQAMLDWLHWGGQLVLIGGAGPAFSIFRDSFLQPYLPADPSGDDALLGEAELRPLSEAYPPGATPPPPPQEGEEPAPPPPKLEKLPDGRPYRPPVAIRPPAKRPVLLSGLRPRPGASKIPLGPGSSRLLAAEARVGRGRITMLALNPTEPTLAAWPGIDTMIRRVVLRRPEEPLADRSGLNPQDLAPPPRGQLDAVDLSWYRIASRDHGGPVQAEADRVRAAELAKAQVGGPPRSISRTPSEAAELAASPTNTEAEEAAMARPGVAEWRDAAPIPRLCRDALEKASGITVPGSAFVLKVIFAYILAIVPLNWLVFRLLLGRREWAWATIPVLALGFAFVVERMAAYDMGYDSACDELDLMEVQAGYPRAHLSRFASLYTTGRARYTVAYPDDPAALALPFNNQRSIGGEETTTAAFRCYPVPALEDYAVQPRSLSMYRAEQYLDLPSSSGLEASPSGGRTLTNGTGLELRDAVLVEDGPDGPIESYVGTIGPNATIELDGGRPPAAVPEAVEGFDGPDPSPLMGVLRKASPDRGPENAGEMRLVAWSPGPRDGQSFEPALDRHRGTTIVLVHLRRGPPPPPDGRRYNLLADAARRRVPEAPAAATDPPARRSRR
ncbi:hypothetical protein [Aquisphaera giovannonii]|uniref:hypothetical protein n=1 Tax=Aquisphaera giovannonii TaxID=406548 RepID=UPI0011E05FB3|nr:hypothetical protein [Aquisphaera giovannonii]